uniref:Ribosome-binding factor A n=1 Tax=uncultured Thiotrichaceae bacterium TaxID=298394 RepID=A0A6S6U6C3_9GAMM|nr:MAG: Ribosome-binding factor A [uncultured Thiotrichaceae bacterium]
MPQHSSHGFARSERVAEQIRRDLAVLIREQVKDPRVGMVTLLDVNVSKDLAYAKIWFDVLDAEQGKIAEETLNKASGFLRRELGRGMKLRITPALKFFYDDTQLKGNTLSALIDKAVADDRDGHSENDSDSEATDTPQRD